VPTIKLDGRVELGQARATYRREPNESMKIGPISCCSEASSLRGLTAVADHGRLRMVVNRSFDPSLWKGSDRLAARPALLRGYEPPRSPIMVASLLS
jgi:hypothetical protein